MPRLRHTNGVTVEVPKEKVDTLLRSGFTAESGDKSTAKRSSSKSSK